MKKKPKNLKRNFFIDESTGRLGEFYITDKGGVIFLLHEGWEEQQRQLAEHSL